MFSTRWSRWFFGDEVQNYSNFFKSAEEIDLEIKEIKDKLFLYNFSNLEEFQKVISQISDKKEILSLKKCFENLKSLYNLIKISDYKELKEKFSFDKVNVLYSEVVNRLGILNLKSNLDNEDNSSSILNIALESIQFTFKKIKEHEMVIADQFREELEKARKELESNFDKKDATFISLLEELKRLFKKKNIEELNAEEMKEAIANLRDIYSKAHTLNTRDMQLSSKYEYDSKFARIHKRIKESHMDVFKKEVVLYDVLLEIKHRTDEKFLDNKDMINNQEYFYDVTKRITIESLEDKEIKNSELARLISENIIKAYLEDLVL